MTAPATLRRMTDLSNTMVRDSLDAIVKLDLGLAKRICRLDEEVDRYHRTIIDQVSLHLFSAARQLERLADHATNIAEDVVYLVEGRIIRHQPEALNGSFALWGKMCGETHNHPGCLWPRARS